MSSYLTSMFQVPLMHLKINDWKNKKEQLEKLFDINQAKSQNVQDPKTDYHHKVSNKLHKENSDILEDIFQRELKQFAKSFEFLKVSISAFWFEIALDGQYHDVHNHGFSGYSSVCFIDFDEEYHKPTNFICPFNDFLYGNVITHQPNEIKEGSLIFFPSVISHYSPPNYSNVPRKILSFNLEVE